MAPAGSEALPGPRGGNPSLGRESQDRASPMAPSFWLLATAQDTPISSGRVGTQRGQTEAGGRRTERNEVLPIPGSGSAGECPSSGNVRAEAFLAPLAPDPSLRLQFSASPRIEPRPRFLPTRVPWQAPEYRGAPDARDGFSRGRVPAAPPRVAIVSPIPSGQLCLAGGWQAPVEKDRQPQAARATFFETYRCPLKGVITAIQLQ